jgi:hypothetical protein
MFVDYFQQWSNSIISKIKAVVMIIKINFLIKIMHLIDLLICDFIFFLIKYFYLYPK